MPAYKDEDRGTWYAKFYYTDCYGNKQQKKKRGFKTKREAKSFEENFLANEAKSPDITFREILDIYYEDVQHKVVPSTMVQKRMTMDRHILPTFGDLPISKITPEMVLSWQNDLRTKSQVWSKKKPLSPRTIVGITGQLAAVFNFAVRYYNLPRNPVNVLDKIKYNQREITFWEIDEFQKALRYSKGYEMRIIFLMLFYGGFRIGELQAITLADLRESDMSVMINKTFKVVDKKWTVGPPKSHHGIRRVPLPEFVWEELQDYISKLYHREDGGEIFTASRCMIRKHLDKAAELAKVKRIRVHDLRHSHVSYLISLGFTIFEIADRIGDTPTVVEMIYAHMYEGKRVEIAQKMQENHKKSAS